MILAAIFSKCPCWCCHIFRLVAHYFTFSRSSCFFALYNLADIVFLLRQVYSLSLFNVYFNFGVRENWLVNLAVSLLTFFIVKRRKGTIKGVENQADASWLPWNIGRSLKIQVDFKAIYYICQLIAFVFNSGPYFYFSQTFFWFKGLCAMYVCCRMLFISRAMLRFELFLKSFGNTGCPKKSVGFLNAYVYLCC